MVGAAGCGLIVITIWSVFGPHEPGGSAEVSVSVTVVSPGAGVYTALSWLGFEKEPAPPDHVPVDAPPDTLPAKVTAVPKGTTWFGPAETTAVGSTVTGKVNEVAGHVPLAGIVLVILCTPGAEAATFISPVVVFKNTMPPDELNTPALAPAGKVGKAVPEFWHNEPYENWAFGELVIVTLAVDVVGQVPPPKNEIVYVPEALAARLIWPVAVLTNTSPAGDALKMPPAGLLMVGDGLTPVLQNVPEEYLNCGLGIAIMDTVTDALGLTHVPTACSI
jgi:hypothetical protein